MPSTRNNWLLGLIALGCLAFIYYLNVPRHVDLPHKTEVAVTTPVRLIIPKIGVDAKVVKVALAKDNSMGAPKGPMSVGWFELGPIPGEEGTAVMDGHRGWMDETKAVFDLLHELKVGDTIYVVDENGYFTAFVVSGTKTYLPGDDTKEVFTSHSGTHLNLITCKGDWNTEKQSYEERLVVFADK